MRQDSQSPAGVTFQGPTGAGGGETGCSDPEKPSDSGKNVWVWDSLTKNREKITPTPAPMLNHATADLHAPMLRSPKMLVNCFSLFFNSLESVQLEEVAESCTMALQPLNLSRDAAPKCFSRLKTGRINSLLLRRGWKEAS